MKNITSLFTAVMLLITGFAANAQIICNPQGNVILYSNYDGGVLNINCDVNIPNLKIGVVSYEMVTINLTGPYVNNVTEVRFAGYPTTPNHHCSNTPAFTSIVGAPAGTDTIIFMPASPVPNSNGYYIIICNYTCDTNTNQGGCNTADQVAAYFMQAFGGAMRYHFTQYGCWNGTYNVSNGGNCCVGAVAPSQLPVCNLQSSDTAFCEKQCIDFTDLSTNSPTSWLWTFTGAVPATSTLQNPTNICYNGYGSFDVSLVACNSFGCDTVTFNNFINEYPNPYDSIWNLNDTLYSLPAYSYQWFNVNTGAMAGAVDSVYIPTTPGDYYCVIADSVGCIGTSNTVTVIGAGLAENELDKIFKLYPNPNEGHFNIELKEAASQITITDGMGKVVYRRNKKLTTSQKLDISIASKGIYLVRVETVQAVYKRKLVVR